MREQPQRGGVRRQEWASMELVVFCSHDTLTLRHPLQCTVMRKPECFDEERKTTHIPLRNDA